MKTKNIGIWAIAALAVSLLAAPAAHSQTERFSATLSGAQEVPPINTAGTGDFQMTIQPGTITFSLTFSGLSSNLAVSPALCAQPGRWWRHDIPVRRWRSTGLPGGDFRNHHRDNHSSECYRTDDPRHCPR